MSDDNTMDSVMIDLETMATGPNAGVIQVGAIPFNSRTGLVKPDLFEVDVDLHSALLLGGEVDASTVQFWRDQGGLQDFEEGGLMRLTAQEVARRVPHLALPKPKPDLYVGEPKKRMTFDVTVVRRYTFARDAWNGYGIETVHIITMIDRATGACLVSKSGAFYAEEGEELKIKATVKEHAEYRGQAQTVVPRIAVLED
ncbi:exonuclease [Pseudomonas phage vB_Pa-PAC6]